MNNNYKIEDFNDPWDVVEKFENMVASYYGADYGVSVDCCSHALFLSLKYYEYLNIEKEKITLPNKNYISVPMQLYIAGYDYKISNIEWSKYYYLTPYNIIDAATCYEQGSYVKNTLFCLSFDKRKALNLAKGGMILTDDYKAYLWLIRKRYDGRYPRYRSKNDTITDFGYHYHMTPENALNGINNFEQLTLNHKNSWNSDYYCNMDKILPEFLVKKY